MGPYSVDYTRGRVCDKKEEDGCESRSAEGTVERGVLNFWGKGDGGDVYGFQKRCEVEDR